MVVSVCGMVAGASVVATATVSVWMGGRGVRSLWSERDCAMRGLHNLALAATTEM